MAAAQSDAKKGQQARQAAAASIGRAGAALQHLWHHCQLAAHGHSLKHALLIESHREPHV